MVSMISYCCVIKFHIIFKSKIQHKAFSNTLFHVSNVFFFHNNQFRVSREFHWRILPEPKQQVNLICHENSIEKSSKKNFYPIFFYNFQILFFPWLLIPTLTHWLEIANTHASYLWDIHYLSKIISIYENVKCSFHLNGIT